SASQLGSGRMDTRASGSLAGRGDELGELARSFDAMAVQLESLMGSHKQLLRDVSHELRSPLARLTVALELARDSAGEAAQEDLSRIGLEAGRLNELIGEVLSLARFEQGAIQADMQAFDFSILLEEVIADATFEAEATGKRVKSDIITEGCRIRGDRLWLQRALDNVLRNAVRHTAASTAIELTMLHSGRFIEINVRDHGEGVPDAALEHIFEPFFRAEEARTRTSGGYGLGLAIAQRVVELHGGGIQAGHAAGGGLLIGIRLPAN
ncbi:MAG: ATP-binding protein, partial [Mariprofundaceae bacterium]|nr:ATP-binding protein [Mariprofundaceae bacterium]